jgi:hypothetical protein
MGGMNSVGLLIIILFVVVGIPIALSLRPSPNEIANTFKFRTIVYIILALLPIPLLWLITLPLFLYLAYRTYIYGKPSDHPSLRPPPSTLKIAEEIETLHRLFTNGVLSEREFQVQKTRLLGAMAKSKS